MLAKNTVNWTWGLWRAFNHWFATCFNDLSCFIEPNFSLFQPLEVLILSSLSLKHTHTYKTYLRSLSCLKNLSLIWLHRVLVVACGIFSFGMQTPSYSIGSSSPPRDRTWAPCIGSVESFPLDHQRRPHLLCFFFFLSMPIILYSSTQVFPLKPHQTSLSYFVLWYFNIYWNI